MKKVLAVFDEDYMYAQRLTDYLNQKKNLPFRVMQFTSEETLKQYADKKEIAVLLISSILMSEGIRHCNIKTVIYLTDMEEKNEWDSGRAVYKYQSAEYVVREIFSCYDALFPPQTIKPIGIGNSKILGVYAPYGGSGRTIFSFLFGVILAERYRVLYLNMEGFSGLKKLFCEEFSNDLSDVLYYGSLKEDMQKVMENSFFQEYRGMKWIPPVCYPEDREYLTKENMENILRAYLESGQFDRIVIDIADHFFFAPNILDLCQELFIPIKDDILSKCKWQEFEEWMERTQRNGMKEKIRRIHLPQISEWGREGDYWEKLLYGDMADYVRSLMQGAGHEK